MFSAELLRAGLFQGALVWVLVFCFYGGLLQLGLATGEARAAAFTALVACSAALILANRSFSTGLTTALVRPNPALWRVLAATATMLAAVLLVAPLRHLFGFDALSLRPLAGALGLGFAALLLIKGGMALGRRASELHKTA